MIRLTVWLKRFRNSSSGITIIMLVLSITIHGMLLATIITRPTVTHAFNPLSDGSLLILAQDELKLSESSASKKSVVNTRHYKNFLFHQALALTT